MKKDSHRVRWTKKILMAFSTLLILEADKPANAAGVHDRSVVITKGRSAARCLTRLTHEFINAERRSTSLENRR